MNETKKHTLGPISGAIGSCYLLVLWLILVCLDVAYRYLYWTNGMPPWNSGTPLFFTMLWALLICGVVFLLPGVLRRIAMIVIPVTAGLMLLVHSSMYKIFGTVFSFADLAYAEDGAKFFSMAYISFRKGLLICVAAAVMGIRMLDASMRESDNETFTWDASVSQDNDKAIYSGFSNVNRCFHLAGSYQYLFRSFTVTYGLEDAMRNGETYKKLDVYYAQSEKKNHPDNEMTGIYADKNVMLFLLESIDTWLLTEDYMPNLYRLQQEGINCENHFAPMFISAGTFGSEFTVNTGLVPPTNGVNNAAYSEYSYPYSLAHLFANKGYAVNSFHPSSPKIYNRGIIHENWGYEKYHSYVEMGMKDYQLDSQMINGYDSMVENDKFFDFILTYSGHGPYTEELDNISADHWDAVYAKVDPKTIPAEGADLEEYYRAVAHAMETDKFIGELVDKMEADGTLDDTVLIFFTDHYCKYMTNTELVMKLKGAENGDMINQTPFFIYSKDTPARSVTKLTSTMDIAPTIANLFGLDVDYAYYTGDDIFGAGGGYVIFRNMNWYDGEIYYSADYSGEMTDYIAEKNKEVSERIQMSWDTLKSNYFAHCAEQEK